MLRVMPRGERRFCCVKTGLDTLARVTTMAPVFKEGAYFSAQTGEVTLLTVVPESLHERMYSVNSSSVSGSYSENAYLLLNQFSEAVTAGRTIISEFKVRHVYIFLILMKREWQSCNDSYMVKCQACSRLEIFVRLVSSFHWHWNIRKT